MAQDRVASAPRCIARAGPLLAQLAVMRLADRCRARRQCGSCFCCCGGRSGLVFGASLRRWHQVLPLRDWFCVAAGYSGAREAPGRSFHPTAVERRNRPSVPRWVENKLNEINGVRQIERQAPHRARRVELLRHRDERHSLSRSDTNREAIISICELRSRPICLILPRSSDRAQAKPSAVR